ncbi:MAG TPA: hypothetical protein VG408_02920 [Actinomycetota bacterium]|nr:hypothetical protein [Actinomycetota bacterium]
MDDIHSYVGYAIPVGFGVLVVLSIVVYLRNREPNALYWNVLAALQVIIGVQFLIGIVLLVSGAQPASNGPTWLHYVYGVAFPALVLAIAHVQARKRPGAEAAIFGVAAFLCCFATLRALQTGLGID